MVDLTMRLLFVCNNAINGKTSSKDAVADLSYILSENKSATSDLLDILTIIDCELSSATESEEKKNFTNFLSKISSEILPEDILKIELNCFGADESVNKSRVVKTKTRLFYKQLKFNLLREESEGYAKLIAELFSNENDGNLSAILGRIRSLIGQFNLDPNRTIDVILDCFEHNLFRRQLFISIIKEFKIDRNDLLDIVCTKFVFLQKNEPINTPFSLYQLAAVLCIEDLVDMHAIFACLVPSQEDIVINHKYYAELCKKRSKKAEMISTASLDIDKTSLSSSMIEDTNVSLSTSVPFSIATQSQTNEDRKLCGTDFDDTVTLAKNQKLGLICALLEYGDWNRAKQLLDRIPEFYAVNRISLALTNIVGYIIEPFYLEKLPENLFVDAQKSHYTWEKFYIDLLEQIVSWDDISSFLYPLLSYLGPYIASQHQVAVKLLRLLAKFFDEEKEKKEKNSRVTSTIMDICDYVLVPSLSLIECNYPFSEELWTLLSNFSYIDRYRLYGRWKNVHTLRYWDLLVQKGKIIGKTRYVMKRLTKETVKLMGRQLGKLCHIHPSIVFDYLLTQIQTFQNFIGPVVDAMRFSSSLEFDVLSFCLIEALASPEKQTLKTETGMISPWLLALASFVGQLYRRYNIELDGMLFYVINQLKDGKSFDLLILREIIQNMSGVDTNIGLTEDQLEAMAGSDFLRQEIGSYSLNKASKRSTTRLKDSLFKPDLIEGIFILIAQQRNSIIFVESQDIPLKLSGQMLDQCQDTLVQFMNFLRGNMKPDDYSKRMQPVSVLINDYFLSIDTAMYFARPIYMHKINLAYDAAKKALKEGKVNKDETNDITEKSEEKNDKSEKEKSTKLDSMQKLSFYITAFDEVVNALEEELRIAFSETFWNELTSRLFSVFWLLSISDLHVPTSLYEQELQKCKNELKDLEIESKTMSKKSVAKEEERLKALEQKLSDELRRQNDHVKRVTDVLATEQFKEQFFAQNQRTQIIRFLQSCILPRAIFTDSDAVFCARFIELLHSQKTDFFHTLILIDKIFNDITPLISGLSENETSCFGRFCNMVLDMIHRWHASKSTFLKECDGFPGCVTKLKKSDDVNETSISYETYRTMCFKWQFRLVSSLNASLITKNYILTRNSLILLTKILSNFPMTVQHYKVIEKTASQMRDQEKGVRDDLSLLAASYVSQLKKRPKAPMKQEEYYTRPVAAKLTTVTSPLKSTSTTKPESTAKSVQSSQELRPIKPASPKLSDTKDSKRTSKEKDRPATAKLATVTSSLKSTSTTKTESPKSVQSSQELKPVKPAPPKSSDTKDSKRTSKDKDVKKSSREHDVKRSRSPRERDNKKHPSRDREIKELNTRTSRDRESRDSHATRSRRK